MARNHFGNPETGEMAPLGKNSKVLSTPNMARGTSGSSTRTIIRNIMPLKAIDVEMMSIRRSKAVTGLKMTPRPANNEPMTTMQTPDNTALMVPARFNPSTSSNRVIGVTRYPSCTPLALSSIYSMPPPIMTATYIASATEPASRYFMYSTYG